MDQWSDHCGQVQVHLGRPEQQHQQALAQNKEVWEDDGHDQPGDGHAHDAVAKQHQDTRLAEEIATGTQRTADCAHGEDYGGCGWQGIELEE